jgi:hypothetical protein
MTIQVQQNNQHLQFTKGVWMWNRTWYRLQLQRVNELPPCGVFPITTWQFVFNCKRVFRNKICCVGWNILTDLFPINKHNIAHRCMPWWSLKMRISGHGVRTKLKMLIQLFNCWTVSCHLQEAECTSETRLCLPTSAPYNKPENVININN